MDIPGIILIVGSVVIVTVLFISNSKKRYGARPRIKDPTEEPTDYARKKRTPPQ